MLKLIFESMRPAQWTKNTLVFAGLIFAERIGQPRQVSLALQAFIIFCIFSSSVYLINDVLDCERDRRHPLKKLRPVASGRLGIRTSLLAALVLALPAVLWSLRLGAPFALLGAAYLVLNLLYTLKLKHVVIVDVMLIGLGFVLRVLAGTVAIGVATSNWILLCTFLLSLFLTFGKRRHELLVLEGVAPAHRDVLVHYSPYFLDQMIAVVTPSTLVCYALYTLSPDTVAHVGSQNLVFTVPFVCYGIFRYLYQIHEKRGGGDPARILLSDFSIMGAVVCWLALVLAVLYL